MNIQDRTRHMQELFDECIAIAESKGADYSGKAEAFANFKRGGERLGLSKYQILSVYLSKHLDSIFNSIKADPYSPQVESEPLRGRVVDAINYLSFLSAMLEEDALHTEDDTVSELQGTDQGSAI